MSAAEAERWLAYAESDLRAAAALLDDPEHYPRQVCFLSQQAAEKAIKAVLIRTDVDFPRSHDLDHLRDLIPDGWNLKANFPDLAALTVWAVESRYPGDMPDVVDKEARETFQLAEALCRSVRAEFQQHGS